MKTLFTVFNAPREIFYRLFRQSGPENVWSGTLTVPNLITACGLALTGAYIFCFLSGTGEILIPIMVVLVGASDLLDGMAARLLNQHTHLGKVLDPLRDRLLGGAVLANIFVQEPSLLPMVIVLAALELLIGGIHVDRLRTAGMISWRAKHTSGKMRQAVHLVAAGIFVFQTYTPGIWNRWLGVPRISDTGILATMMLASAYALVMLFIHRVPLAAHGLRF